jgi:hypothetical protein
MSKRRRAGLEHKKEPVASARVFAIRMVKATGYAVAVVAVSLFVGMCGYHYLEDLPWIDAYVNATMILSGMGPVNAMQTTAGKIFAGTYAIYSGLLLIAVTGLLLGPLFHRVLHIVHLETDEKV